MKNKILQMDPSETVELEVGRHPIGLVPVYAVGGFITIILAALPFLLNTATFKIYTPQLFQSGWLDIIFILMAVLVAIMTQVAAVIYNNNVLMVTNENLIQVLQHSIFSRQLSQLSLEKVQDVTAVQNGFFARIFDLGTIQVETAGETANFSFKLAPNPNVVAKEINEAHERFIKKYGIDVI